MADHFIIVTNIAFDRGGGWQRRHKIRAHDRDHWLTVPVLGSQHQLIKDVRINNTVDWRRKHTRALHIHYGATLEPELLAEVLALYRQPWERLVDINYAFIRLLATALEIDTPMMLDEEVSGRRQHLVVNICNKYGADTYLSGLGGKLYMDDAFIASMAKEGVVTSFVDRDIASAHPYTTLHYVLTKGRAATRALLT